VTLSPCLALHLLGPPRLEIDSSPVSIDRRKTLALLAYLAVNLGSHTRDFLSALLFPDYDQSKAFRNLRHTLWETQQAIGEGWIVADHETIGLIAGGADQSTGRVMWLDVAQFESLITQSRAHAQRDISLRIPLLTDSIKLYRNHFLTGFSLKDAPSFNEWAMGESDNLRHQLAHALTLLAEDHCSLGRAETAIPYARRLIALDPLNEASHRQLMQVYIQAGQHNAALKQYKICEHILRKELGVDPQPETRALYKQIRKGEIKPIQPVKQKETVTPQHNIPFQISKFIGREKEMDDVADLIANNRLVTLVGTGGIGKTRLSLKVGEGLLKEFADGICLVELASLSNPALVPQTVAKLFQLVEQAGESLTEKLIRVLRPKNMLMILDNCEHLLDASAQIADTLLKNCPNLKILTTSREPLGITGEAQYHVPPLELPDLQQILERLLDYESIQLFEERARLVQEHFSLTMENASSVTQICHRLDGIPLALELAAARVDSFSTEQIASRLDERFNLLTGGSRTALPRQQTLRASIDWSWNLLSEPEQILLQRLSVFAGGWTLDAAEAVCAGNGNEPQNVLDIMTDIAAKSLIIVNQNPERGMRYYLLETIRQYTHEKLREADEVETISDKHLAWALAWAEEVEPELHGWDQVIRLKEVDIELHNIRLAIEWGLDAGQAESSMRIFVALSRYLDGHSHFAESRRWLEAGISLRHQLTRNTLAKTLSKAAWFTFRQNDPEAGIPYAKESLALAETLEDQQTIAYALNCMGVTQISNGDFIEAGRHFEKALFIYKNLDDTRGIARTVSNGALALAYQSNFSGAIELLKEYLSLVQNLEDLSTVAWFQFGLGTFRILHGEFEQSVKHLKKGLSLYYQINNIYFIGNCMIGLAGAANGRGQPLQAARFFGAREAIHESIGSKLDSGVQPIYASLVAQTRAMLDESAFGAAWAEGRAMTLDEAVEYAMNDG
jgi:predicted ATPase/DNA-binding SARP family transcriptional activator